MVFGGTQISGVQCYDRCSAKLRNTRCYESACVAGGGLRAATVHPINLLICFYMHLACWRIASKLTGLVLYDS
jgi:hypothetical protein